MVTEAEMATMVRARGAVGRLLTPSGSMLDHVRLLFLAFCLSWPVFGLFAVEESVDRTRFVVVVIGATVLDAWWCVGYRRRGYPLWGWLFEGLMIAGLLIVARFESTVVLVFVWANYRVLYGGGRESAFGAVTVVGSLATGALLTGHGSGLLTTAPTAVMSLTIMHVLANAARGRDDAVAVENAVLWGTAALVAASTRTQALEATAATALRLTPSARGAVVGTIRQGALRIGAMTGGNPTMRNDEVALSVLPAASVEAVGADTTVVIEGEAAVTASAALGIGPHPVLTLAPLAVGGEVFGLVAVAMDERDRSGILTTGLSVLAHHAAHTLDQLLASTRLKIIFENSPDGLLLASSRGLIRFANPAAGVLLGCPHADLVGRDLRTLVHPEDVGVVELSESSQGFVQQPCRIGGVRPDVWTQVELTIQQVVENDGSLSLVVNTRDISEREHLEVELRHAQKLESVGRLSAGIAHEINTPIQFVGDNVRFLDTAFTDLRRLCEAYWTLAETIDAGTDTEDQLRDCRTVAADIDIDFLLAEVPEAIAQTLDGVGRVATIVRAMRAFGHPGTEQKNSVDLNEAILNTLVVANNEVKYVADVETDLGELPPVRCHLGDVNQVVLNLVVNAAHAIDSAGKGRGVIRVATRMDAGHAVIEVSDTGTGIDPRVADKVFDQFFTTKEVGTGTGQGLALARSLVVDRHGGLIEFATEPGVGTTFTVRLPATHDLADREEAR